MYTFVWFEEYLKKYFPSILGKREEAKHKILGFEDHSKGKVEIEIEDRDLNYSYVFLKSSNECILSFNVSTFMLHTDENKRIRFIIPDNKGERSFFSISGEIDTNGSMRSVVDQLRKHISNKIKTLLNDSVEIASCGDLKVFIEKHPNSKVEWYRRGQCTFIYFVRGNVVLNLIKLSYRFDEEFSSEEDMTEHISMKVVEVDSRYAYEIDVKTNTGSGYVIGAFERDIDKEIIKLEALRSEVDY